MSPAPATRAVLLAAVLAASPAAARAGVFPDSPFSSKASGSVGAVFLKMPSGARALALGGSNAAAAEGSDALFWNPAGLAKLQESGLAEAGLSYNSLLEGTNAGTLAFAKPLADDKGVVGASFEYFLQSSIQGYSTLGDPTDTFSPSDMAFAGAYARKFAAGQQPLRGGAVLKIIRSKVADASGTSFAMDFGVQAERVTDIGEGPLDLGMAVRNLGPAIKVGSVADPLPFQMLLGAQWRVSPYVNMLLDGHIPVDHGPYPSIGGEFHTALAEDAHGALRVGMDFRDGGDIDGLAGFRAGAGLDLKKFRLDYAWVPFGELGTTHRVSMAVRF